MSVPAMVAGQLISAGIGAYGANQAANAQETAARQAADAARRNTLMGIQANEPLRYTGYQALGDINSFFGYNTSPYTSAQQLATSTTPVTAKQVLRAIKGGASFDQIAQMGVLGQGTAGGKYIKRLQKAGLSMDQINQLRTGYAQQGVATSATNGATNATPGQMNWDAITQAPDYQFQLQQGTKDIGNSFAARGGAASGNALRALSQFNQGLASQGLDKFISRRMGLVNGGNQATDNVTQIGTQGTGAQMNALQSQGDARASGILGTTNSIGNAINSGFNNYFMGKYLQGQQQPQPMSPYGPYAGGYQFPRGY